LSPAELNQVQAAFNTWRNDAELAQVLLSITAETALAVTDFASLLSSFAIPLAQNVLAKDCWPTSCRAHQRKGRQVPVPNCPSVLGRVKGLDDHARAIEQSSKRALTKQEARRQLLKCAGKKELEHFDPFLRRAPLGKFLIWATFDEQSPSCDPFERLPPSHDAIRTALGLGHSNSDQLLLLTWDHEPTASPLHRPTVADAGGYTFYRPRPEADAHWGLTSPLLPNPSALAPQPEVVLAEISSHSLRLPFRVVTA
jgi:hypothetical protein